MEIGWSVLWFIVAISLLVTIHEFGHFWVARKLGFKVLRFSVGFGKPLYKRVGPAPDHTEFVIAALPLGGYVRMLDERDGAVAPEDLPRAFTRRPPWQRILVLLAGPAANIVFAVLVLWVMFWVNGVNHVKAVVDRIVVDSPAAAAGLANGDEIRSINGEPVTRPGGCDARVVRRGQRRRRSRHDVRKRDRRRAHRHAHDCRSGRCATSSPSRTSSTWVWGSNYWMPPHSRAMLGAVEAGGPADKAGLKAGDDDQVDGWHAGAQLHRVSRLRARAPGPGNRRRRAPRRKRNSDAPRRRRQRESKTARPSGACTSAGPTTSSIPYPRRDAHAHRRSGR